MTLQVYWGTKMCNIDIDLVVLKKNIYIYTEQYRTKYTEQNIVYHIHIRSTGQFKQYGMREKTDRNEIIFVCFCIPILQTILDITFWIYLFICFSKKTIVMSIFQTLVPRYIKNSSTFLLKFSA